LDELEGVAPVAAFEAQRGLEGLGERGRGKHGLFRAAGNGAACLEDQQMGGIAWLVTGC
jgi:hypothetical protein